MRVGEAGGIGEAADRESLRGGEEAEMSKMRNMRGIEIPSFRAVSSGPQTLEQLFGPGSGFSAWVREHEGLLKRGIYEPNDFLWHEDGDVNRSVWIIAVGDHVTQVHTAPYEIIEFPGGVFLTATADESNPEDLEETVNDMMDWIRCSQAFSYGDFPPSGMCNMPNPDGVFDCAMGIAQQQIFLPLKLKQLRGNE